LTIITACIGTVAARGQKIGSPAGIKSEQSLPSRYPYVVADMLEYCRPQHGFWVDLGAGKGQVTIPLIEKTDNPVIMVDPNAEALAEGLQKARDMGLADRLFAVVGAAEKLPLPDNSVDLLVSRGSIFFWDDAPQGLREVYRVLRPGGKAYIGGGAGSGYPQSAVQELIAQRKKKMEGDEAEKWQRFVELRRPEQMREWADAAGLTDYTIMGQGAISAEDERVGQGVWILFGKER
jgi:ubiquinone/menaquinone biosynthesis C-methylase UbiE